METEHTHSPLGNIDVIWQKGIQFEDDEKAKEREDVFRLSRPDSYYAKQTSFGNLVDRNYGYHFGPRQNPRLIAEEWLLARYIARQRKAGIYK